MVPARKFAQIIPEFVAKLTTKIQSPVSFRINSKSEEPFLLVFLGVWLPHRFPIVAFEWV